MPVQNDELSTLGNSLILAQKRLNQTIKKLGRDPYMHRLYCEFPEEYLLTDNSKRIILLGYCDDSIAAFGAVVYLRSYCENYTPTTKLLASKSRVIPLRTISIPRLEWYSTIAIAWTNSSPHQLKTFVANRVSKIQALTANISSRDNPADLISRGVNPSDLEHLELWWSGPSSAMEEIIDDSRQNDLNSSEKELYLMGLKTSIQSNNPSDGVTWSSTQDVMCTAYKCYARHVVYYGNEVLIAASDSVRKRLNLFQSSMLRLITGGTKSTPRVAMELQTDLEPLSERSQSALNLVEKILRRRNNFLNYYRPTKERLKTHKFFLSTVHDLYDTSDIPTIFLHPTAKFSHRNSTLLCARYPLDKWFHVYSDGSAEDVIKNAGSGAVASAFNVSYPVGKYCDKFDGEIAAISFTIDKLESCSELNIVFFIDSQAAILSLIKSRYNETH
ncbi:uncharacterized protein TNCV_3881351 [Trichonephila clavipes]|nr:uncharacterized protein TNCV_3881351 [Trichonephila clavipes]